MKTIGFNKALIKDLVGDLSLFSSSIRKISIYIDEDIDVLCVDVFIKLLYRNNKLLLLKFKNVTEYSFSYYDSHYFYNIENFKFINEGGYNYLSFDPADNLEQISNEDQDFIKSVDVEGIICDL